MIDDKNYKKLDVKRLLINQKLLLNCVNDLLIESNYYRNEIYLYLQDIIVINQILRKKFNEKK